MQHIREKLAWAIVATLALFVAAAITGVVSGGPLDPPNPPVSTPNGIDGRIPIDRLPFTIADSGSYVVTRDLAYADGNGINVTADNVTIDLNGFTLDGVNQNTNGIHAIGRRSLSVVNGTLRRWSTGIQNDYVQGNEGGGLFQHLELSENVYGAFLVRGAKLDTSIVRSNTNGLVLNGHAATVTNSTFAENATAIVSNSQDNLIESNHFEIPLGGIGIQAGDFTTIRGNFFGNPSIFGYVTIALGTANYVVAIENRMTASLTTGGPGTGTYIPYDTNNALTNLSP